MKNEKVSSFSCKDFGHMADLVIVAICKYDDNRKYLQGTQID